MLPESVHGRRMMIEAVIFDMDGLLVDSEPLWFRARVALLTAHGKEWTAADQLAMAGVHTQVWIDALHDRLEATVRREAILEDNLARMESYYESGDVSILAGASEALEHCAQHYRVGLASGSPRRLIDACLSGAGWNRYFESVISGDELEHGKPAPDIYLEIIRRMDLNPATAAVVEDSGAGIKAGKAAGTKVIAVPNPHTDPGPEVVALADARIGTLDELPATLATL